MKTRAGPIGRIVAVCIVHWGHLEIGWNEHLMGLAAECKLRILASDECALNDDRLS